VKAELIDLDFVRADGGGILKIIKKSSRHFNGFGELYFSQIAFGAFRGWKNHQRIESFVFVLEGAVSFHFFGQEGECYSIHVDRALYSQKALRIPAGLSFGFKSETLDGAVIANFASSEHSPDEALRLPLSKHACGWEK
jgi:dTDP-4-dehydrorhamnose 3,5-epimerase